MVFSAAICWNRFRIWLHYGFWPHAAESSRSTCRLKINQRLGWSWAPDHYDTDNGSDDAGDFEMQENNYFKSNFTSI